MGSKRRRFRCTDYSAAAVSWRAAEQTQPVAPAGLSSLAGEIVAICRTAAAGRGLAERRSSPVSVNDRWAKMTCSYDGAVFILPLFFHLCARRLLIKSARRTMLPSVHGATMGGCTCKTMKKQDRTHCFRCRRGQIWRRRQEKKHTLFSGKLWRFMVLFLVSARIFPFVLWC